MKTLGDADVFIRQFLREQSAEALEEYRGRPEVLIPCAWIEMMVLRAANSQSPDEEPQSGDEVSAANTIARLTQENEDLRIRNLELEDAVAKMQDGIRAIQQHQTKRRK